MAASSVEAMQSIDELFDKIAVSPSGVVPQFAPYRASSQAVTDIDVMPGVNDPRYASEAD